MTDHDRDPVVARALRGLAVPDHAPGFWERLDERLAARPEVAAADDDIRVPTGELPAVALLRPEAGPPRHQRQRFLAAAAVVAVLALTAGVLLRGDNDDERPIEQAATTTAAAPPETPWAFSTPVTPTTPSTATLPELGGTTARAEAAVWRWIDALAAGDREQAVALLGPLTLRVLDAQGMDPYEAFAEGYGAWAPSPGKDISSIAVPGGGAVVVISGTRMAEGAEEQRTEAIPVVRAPTESEDAWFVEPLGYGASPSGRLEIRTPGPDPGHFGSWTGQMPDVVFEVAAAEPGTTYWFALDGAPPVASDDGTWDPPGDLGNGTHLLVVAAVGEGIFGAVAGTFVVEG